MSGKIVVVGSSNTDMIIKTPSLPRAGETVLGGEFSMAAGGKGANQAVAAARAGGNVTLIACLGEDIFGEQALEGFVGDGINVEYIFRDSDTPSGIALIFVDEGGENSIAVASGANARLMHSHIEQAEEAIASADILVMQLETPIETVNATALLAASHDVKVILNPAPARPLEGEILRHVSILTPNETEAEMLTGIRIRDGKGAEKAAGALLNMGVDAALITMGAGGAYLATPDGGEMVTGYGVRSVDTTGAGDVFNGALAAAMAEGRTLLEAARFANAAAALSVTKLGAQPSVPHRKEIDYFLEAHGGL